jgi:hypothetical protein
MIQLQKSKYFGASIEGKLVADFIPEEKDSRTVEEMLAWAHYPVGQTRSLEGAIKEVLSWTADIPVCKYKMIVSHRLPESLLSESEYVRVLAQEIIDEMATPKCR